MNRGELAEERWEADGASKVFGPSFTTLRGKLWMNGKIASSSAGAKQVLRDRVVVYIAGAEHNCTAGRRGCIVWMTGLGKVVAWIRVGGVGTES